MKNSLLLGAAVLVFAVAGPMTISAAPTHATARNHATDVTGCLEAGPVAKEYLVHTADGTTWGVNETDRDLRLNNYVGQMVTIVGDSEHATSAEQKAGGANHYVYARDVMVAGESCQK